MTVASKIRKLRMMSEANGASEEEAMSAMRIADNLMRKHGITEEELLRSEFKDSMRTASVDNQVKRQHPAAKWCGVMIGKFCGVRVWNQNGTLKFFGLNQDTLMAEYLFEIISKSMDRTWRDYLKSTDVPKQEKHTQYWSYRRGFADRINVKLKEIMEARDLSSQEAGLIVLKETKIEEALAIMIPNLSLSKSKSKSIAVDPNSYMAGSVSGDRVNLNRPIRSHNKKHTQRIA